MAKSDEKIKILVLCGPTATGKSELAISLCKALSGEVVSADSMQIYDELRIGTARPTEAEMGGVPHHLMGFLPPDASFSVADYSRAAGEKISEIAARGKLPCICGGTGLYISSLCDGVRFGGDSVDRECRERLRARADEIGAAALHAELAGIDPQAAEKLHQNDTVRVTRALEIYYSSGKTKTEWESVSRTEGSPFLPIMIGLTYRDRATLYRRIDARVERMLSEGLVAEARALFSRGLEKSQAMQAIGYKELAAYFRKECELPAAVEQIKRSSRRYAKRQLTWFRRDERVRFIELDDLSAEEKLSAALEIWEGVKPQ